MERDCGPAYVSTINLQFPRANQFMPTRARKQFAHRGQGEDCRYQLLAVWTHRKGDLLLALSYPKDCYLPDHTRWCERPHHSMAVNEVHDACGNVRLRSEDVRGIGRVGIGPRSEVSLGPRIAVKAGYRDRVVCLEDCVQGRCRGCARRCRCGARRGYGAS